MSNVFRSSFSWNLFYLLLILQQLLQQCNSYSCCYGPIIIHVSINCSNLPWNTSVCIKIYQTSVQQFDPVNTHLSRFRRCAIETKSDYNNLIRSVMMQLKTTSRGLTSEIVPHQMAEYMAKEVSQNEGLSEEIRLVWVWQFMSKLVDF